MKIFISYRRDDSAGYAGRLFDHLAAHFGTRNVFIDIDTIDAGEDFRKVVHNAVGTCDVVLVLVGKQWVRVTDDQGRRRLDDPRDWVRVEIASALANPKVRVIPVLLRDASMPSPEELPDDLKELAWRNAIELSDQRFRFDANQLIGVIERMGAGSGRKTGALRLWGPVLVLALLGLFLLVRFNLIPIPFFQAPTATQIATATPSDTAVSSPVPATRQLVDVPVTGFPLQLREIQPSDLSMPSLWRENGIELVDMRSPGRVTYSGVVRAEQEYQFFLYWCATNARTLTQNLENMKVSFAVNGEAVPEEYILTYDHNPDGSSCKYAVIALSGWVADEIYTLEAQRNILQKINDGATDYPAGMYVREITVTAQ